jgi:PAS domain S-box-containing protein
MESVKMNLLLVEDEALIGLAESRALEREGYSVTHVLTGEAALHAVNSNGQSIDLILMDINLGDGIDGTEAAQEILRRHDIPIVFLSSHIDAFNLQKAERINAYGFVVKNLGYTMLFATIKMAFKLHQAHKQIEMREVRFKNLIDSVHEGICITDDGDRFVFCNSVAESIFGVGPGELVGKPLSMFITNEHLGELGRLAHKAKALEEDVIQDIVGADGIARKLQLRIVPEFDSKHHLTAAIAVFKEISEQRETENARDERDIEEKVLLRELEHRVKNSLNIIMSLLSLDAQRLTDESAKHIVVMAEARIRSVSLLYDYLSHSATYDRVNSADYVHDLIQLLKETYIYGRNDVRMRELVDSFEVDSRFCLPMGLIINELLSNALKYAFPSGQGGTVTIELRKTESEALLSVRDDGVGLPESSDWKSSAGFGLKLVNDLVNQLRGKIEITNRRGLAVTISARLGTEKVAWGTREKQTT